MPEDVRERLSRISCPGCGNTGGHGPIQLEEAAVMCWVVEYIDPAGLGDSPEVYTASDLRADRKDVASSRLAACYPHGGHYQLACYSDAHAGDDDSAHRWPAPDWVVRELFSNV